MSVTYFGYPQSGKWVARIKQDDKLQDLPLRRDVYNHAEAFAWGPVMIGTRESKALVPGAAQLALALLCHALNNDGRAQELHQRFKMRAMRDWPANKAWVMTVDEITATCDKIEEDAQTSKQRSEIKNEPVAFDREPSAGIASEFTSAGHLNEIPGDKVKDDDA